MLVVSGGAPTSAGGRNALLSSARLLLCFVGGTFHASLTPDSFVAMTDEDNAGVPSFTSFHVSASFFCNKTMVYTHTYNEWFYVTSITKRIWYKQLTTEHVKFGSKLFYHVATF